MLPLFKVCRQIQHPELIAMAITAMAPCGKTIRRQLNETYSKPENIAIFSPAE
jgi:hypothetical protein